jgi:hypothetical protein
MSGGRKSEKGHEQWTKTQQEASPRREDAIETTVAPVDKAEITMEVSVFKNQPLFGTPYRIGWGMIRHFS